MIDLDEKIKQFVLQTKENIIVDFITGTYVVENHSFNEGIKSELKLQGSGKTIEDAYDSFFYKWEQNKKTSENKEDNDVSEYYWHVS